MKKIDVYILKKFLGTFVYAVFLLVLISCIIDYSEKNDDFISKNVPLDQITYYYLSFIPFIVTLLTPITAFISVVFVTANMAAKTEIVAILASGVSFRRLLVPFMIGSCMIGLMSFLLANFIIPKSNDYRLAFEMEYIDSNGNSNNNYNNIHLKISDEDYLYIKKYNPNRDIGYDVTFEKIVNNQLLQKLKADRIHWDPDTKRWKVKQWQLREIKVDSEYITPSEPDLDFDTLLNLDPSDLSTRVSMESTLNLPELNEHIKLLKDRGADNTQSFVVEKYVRLMHPFALVILCFIGVVISAGKSRNGTGYQIALGFLIAFIFIIFFTLAKSIAEAGTLDPLIAVWIPNVIFMIVGLILYRTVPR